LQVFGGHGYVSEWGIEQNVRDARIPMIYEGTNEIQAIDLLMRKVLGDGAQALGAMLDELSASLDPIEASHAQVLTFFASLRQVTDEAKVVQAQPSGSITLSWIAGDYLRLAALALLAWSWTRIESAQNESDRWRAPAQALRAWVLPEFDMRLAMIRATFQAHV
jgi:hypothetical protein